MLRTPLALAASSALILPGALVAPPAEAVSLSITNCAKTKYGVEVRIKIRDEGATGRVRVSHPRGKGNFREPRVARTSTLVRYTGDGGGVQQLTYGNDPSFRTDTSFDGRVQVVTAFKLRNGKTINLTCTMR